MAQLQDRTDITVEDLEESLGLKKLNEFIKKSEELFVERTRLAIDEACNNPEIKAIFISGPTSSGKTTFTMHLANGLSKSGRPAAFLCLEYRVRRNDRPASRRVLYVDTAHPEPPRLNASPSAARFPAF